MERYGQDNADYLMEFEQGWIKEYKRAYFVRWEEFDTKPYEKYTKDCADYLGWEYKKVQGDSSLLQRMLDGNWDEADFLVVEPGKKIAESISDHNIIISE